MLLCGLRKSNEEMVLASGGGEGGSCCGDNDVDGERLTLMKTEVEIKEEGGRKEERVERPIYVMKERHSVVENLADK